MLTIRPEKGSQTDKACAYLIWVLIALLVFLALIVAITLGSVAAHVQAGHITWPEVFQLLAGLL